MWNTLNSPSQLEQIRDESYLKKILIYKHSTRCSISRTVLDRLERNWKSDDNEDAKLYFLDLLSFREISSQVEDVFKVEHESPQVLIISKGQSIYDRSHLEIDYHQIKTILKS